MKTKNLGYINVILFALVLFLPMGALAGEEGQPCDQNRSCRDPLLTCKTTSSSGTGICVCRWGNFEQLVGIPGFPLSICELVNRNSGNKVNGPLGATVIIIANIIEALTIVAAVVSMVVGGYIYMTAGGSASRVGLAKVWIGSALLGLILALSAYILLGVMSVSLG